MTEAVATAPVAAPAAPAAAPVAPPVAAPAAPSWHDSLDPGLKTWATGKSYDMSDPAKVATLALNGHMNAEKMLGADRAGRTVVLPPDMNDAEAMGQVYNKLGRPANADGYDIPIPEGADPSFAKAASGWFHESGLTKAQAQNVAKKWNEHVASEVQRQQAAEQLALQEEHRKLEVDWGTGPAAEMQREIARRAVVKLGLDETSIAALEKVVGFSKVMKAFAKVGELTGEAEAVGLGENSGSFSTTPEAAIARRTQLMADKEWGKRAMNPQSAEWAELTRLNQVIAANQSKG